MSLHWSSDRSIASFIAVSDFWSNYTVKLELKWQLRAIKNMVTYLTKLTLLKCVSAQARKNGIRRVFL